MRVKKGFCKAIWHIFSLSYKALLHFCLQLWSGRRDNYLDPLHVINAHREPCRCVTLAPTDRKFASASDDSTIKVSACAMQDALPVNSHAYRAGSHVQSASATQLKTLSLEWPVESLSLRLHKLRSMTLSKVVWKQP